MLNKRDRLDVAESVGSLIDHLGRTRIILVPDHPDEALDSQRHGLAYDRLKLHERDALDALSTFRWGFSHTMASQMLSGAEIRAHDDTGDFSIQRFLRELCKKGVLRYGAGWYHLPASLQRRIYQPVAEYHLQAGLAFTPYASDMAISGVAVDRAFLPEYIYEALYHFTHAEELSLTTTWPKRTRLSNIARDTKVQVLCFAASPSIATTTDLLATTRGHASREAVTLSMQLLKRLESSHVAPLHPEYYLLAIRCALLWRSSGDISNRPILMKLLDNGVLGCDGLSDKAIASSEYAAYAHPRYKYRLAALSYYTTYASCLDKVHRSRIEATDKEMLVLLKTGADPSAIIAPWFFRAGNDIASDTDAARVYQLGIQYKPTLSELWIIQFGTSKLLGDTSSTESTLQEYIAAQSTERPVPSEIIDSFLARIIVGAQRRVIKNPSLRVAKRWNTGIATLRNLYGHLPKVREALSRAKTY
jgi:hypothetical protein